MQKRIRRTFVAAIAAAAVCVPVQPAAAAPTATDESFSFQKAVAFDALANDSSDTDTPFIVGNTQPTNGAATCSANGACLYTANPGYVGPDSFTYTVSDLSGAEDEATVTLTVVAAPAGPLFPSEDQLATTAGNASSVNVLTNDSGGAGPLTVPANSTPPNGTAACSLAGDCLYTPNPGFSGTDGFTYDVTDGSTTKTGVVHVTVAPTGASFALTVGASPTSTGANWKVGANPNNVPQEAAGAVGVPGLTASPEAPQAIEGSPTGAAAWTPSTSGNSAVATPTGAALAGDSLRALFPPPLPPISQGTGGDGHVPILVGSRVFAFYHHASPTSITCVDRQAGTLCPGYPKSINFYTNDYMSGPAVVVGTRFWTHLNPRPSYTQTAPIGLLCWDSATDATCGLTIVDRAPTTLNPQVSAPRLVNGKMWFGGETGLLYCVDPITGVVCAPIVHGIGDSFGGDNSHHYDSVAHGDHFYLSTSTGPLTTCINITTRATCSGWAVPVPLGSYNLVTRYSTGGVADGVCGTSGSSLICVSDEDSTVTETLTGWVSGDIHYSFTSEAETGTRTMYGALSRQGMSCYDWTTRAACTGGSYSGGNITQDKDGNGLPGSGAYGTAFDGACAVGLGDNGQVFTVDPAGVSPCTSLATGTAGQVIDLRTQRCDGTVGNATWGDVALVDANLSSDPQTGDFESLIVTVRDALTGEVLASAQLVGTSGVIDLSGVSAVAHPALTIGASAITNAGTTAWDDGNWPKAIINWNADAAGLCLTTAAPPPCPPGIAALNAAFVDGSQSLRRTVNVALSSACVGAGIFNRNGYLMIAQDGGVFASGPNTFFGDSSFLGAVSAGDGMRALSHTHGPPFIAPQSLQVLNAPIVGGDLTSTRLGYILAAADGGLFTFGDAAFRGSMGGTKLNAPVTGIAFDPDGSGYWMVATDGGVFSFDAPFFGSMGGTPLNRPVVDILPTSTGRGYWLVADDGGVFAFGDAAFAGSLGALKLNKPIVSATADQDGKGYYLVASDGGVFAFDAAWHGSTGGMRINAPVVGMVADPDGKGYWLAAEDGGVFSFEAPFLGSVAHLHLNETMSAITAT